jgi:starch synthase
LRIALVSFDFGEYCVRLADGLSREAEVLLVLPEPLLAAHSALLSGQVQTAPFAPARLRQPLRQLQIIRSILVAVEAFEPDVVHFQHRHLWFNLFLGRLARYPLVITIHDVEAHSGDRESTKTPQRLSDVGYHRADRVVVHNEYGKNLVMQRLSIPAERIDIVPHIALGSQTKDVTPRDDGHTLLFFGRIWPYKGLEVLIRAEPLISAEVPDVEIVIAGRGEDMDRYYPMMVHPERFTVLNRFIPDSELAELFGRASLVVLPYVEASQSGVIPLAYTFARPVVATRVGGLPEMVDDGFTGLLVPPRDEAALARAIVRLLQDPDLRRQMGRRGQHKVETEWSPEAIGHQTLAAYRRAVAERGAR